MAPLAAGDPCRGGHALDHRLRSTFSSKTTHGQCALGNGVNLAIRAEKRRDQKGPAQQRLGVAERADGDIDPSTLTRKGRQGCRYHDGGDILGVDVLAAGADAQTLEHGFQALRREGRVAQAVAGAIQADYQAITHQHIVAHAFELGDVFDARTSIGVGGKKQRRSERGCDQDEVDKTKHMGPDLSAIVAGPFPCEDHANPPKFP